MSRRWHLRRVKVREEALDEGEDEDVPERRERDEQDDHGGHHRDEVLRVGRDAVHGGVRRSEAGDRTWRDTFAMRRRIFVSCGRSVYLRVGDG